MNDSHEFRLEPDDPRLTAYALDELDGEERAQVGAAVAADASLRAAVDEIRATAGQLTAALKTESLPGRSGCGGLFCLDRGLAAVAIPQSGSVTAIWAIGKEWERGGEVDREPDRGAATSQQSR